MKKLILIVFCLTACLSASWAQSSDNGDGTFTNPVLWTDLPDPDVIQVGDTFYFVSTSMHMLPGVTLLKSHDLVNWSIAANVVPRFDNDPYFNLQGGNRYAKGQWATALRYWGGEFHVLFTSNTNGTFIYSSPIIEGEWRKTVVYDGPYHPILDRLKTLKEQDRGDGYHHHVLYDPGFLVDTDGRVYVVHGNSILYITELDPVALQPLGEARVLYKPHREGLEGNRPYHIGDYYYIICTYGGSHSGNVTCLRSHSLEGPWEEREVMCSGARMADNHILQACLVTLESEETWAMAFLDMGTLGRIPHLVPVHWINDWPVFGDWANGNITLPKPVVAISPVVRDLQSPTNQSLPTSDDFSSSAPGLQWQFNHNPDPAKYSLTERPGWLRLHATKPHFESAGIISPESSIEISPDAPLLMARNTLTQRLFGPRCQITAKVDASHLKRGDKAGLAILNIPYGTLTITRVGNKFSLQQTEGDNNSETVGEIVSKGIKKDLWLRADINGQYGLADFSYSLDDQTYHPIGHTFKMAYSGDYFVGNRAALFCYNSNRSGGFLDVDDFHVEILPLFDRNVSVGSTLQAEWTDALWRTECTAHGDGNMDVSWIGDGGLIEFRCMTFSNDIRKAVFTLRNTDSHHTFIELTDGETREVIGRADIMEPTATYQEVEMMLSRPLTDTKDIVVRIWNHDWDIPKMGEVLIDKITFDK